MTLKLMGKKRGMTRLHDDAGNIVVCSVIHVEPGVITQIKRKETDGYNALQLGFGKVEVNDSRTLLKRFSKQLIGHFKKANVEPRRYLAESRTDDIENYSVGQEIDLTAFGEVEYIDVSGFSTGKGYQGVIKRHNFAGGPGAHGSGFHRHAGSTGMRSTPGRCLPGGKKAGQMGNELVTVQNLRIVHVDLNRQLLLVEGAIPGKRGALVSFSVAKKKRKKKQDKNKK